MSNDTQFFLPFATDANFGMSLTRIVKTMVHSEVQTDSESINIDGCVPSDTILMQSHELDANECDVNEDFSDAHVFGLHPLPAEDVIVDQQVLREISQTEDDNAALAGAEVGAGDDVANLEHDAEAWGDEKEEEAACGNEDNKEDTDEQIPVQHLKSEEFNARDLRHPAMLANGHFGNAHSGKIHAKAERIADENDKDANDESRKHFHFQLLLPADKRRSQSDPDDNAGCVGGQVCGPRERLFWSKKMKQNVFGLLPAFGVHLENVLSEPIHDSTGVCSQKELRTSAWSRSSRC